MSSTGNTQTHSDSYYDCDESSLKVLEQLLYVLANLDVIDNDDCFWILLGVRLSRKLGRD
jgi:hypothetical protein